MAQLHWEEVEENMELPQLIKQPTSRQLVRYAGASGDFYEIHYDKDFAQGNSLPGPILHGALKNAFLAQIITDWMGEGGTLKKLTCQYRGMDVPGDTVTGKGTVVRKYEEAGQHLVECEVWLENGQGERTTPGSATIALPSRSA